MLLSFLFYAPATVLFVRTRREQGRKTFTPIEIVLCAAVVVIAVVAVIGLFAGWISI